MVVMTYHQPPAGTWRRPSPASMASVAHGTSPLPRPTGQASLRKSLNITAKVTSNPTSQIESKVLTPSFCVLAGDTADAQFLEKFEGREQPGIEIEGLCKVFKVRVPLASSLQQLMVYMCRCKLEGQRPPLRTCT